MGCDIHWYVERIVDERWELVWPGMYELRSDLEERGVLEGYPGRIVETAEEYCRFSDAEYVHPLHVNRNYCLFGVLAGLRGGLEPISAPRGMPEGPSREYLWEAERWGDDGHTHSWYLLSELLAYDWKSVGDGLEYLKGFVERTLPAMQGLGKSHEVRAVFFFDN